MAGTKSRAFIFRVTPASAMTVMVSHPNTRRKLAGMVAPMRPGGTMGDHWGFGVLGFWGWGYGVVSGLICSRYQVPYLPFRAWETVF